MESVGVFPDGEWEFLGSIFNSDEVDSLPGYLGNFPLPEYYHAGLISAWHTCLDPPAGVSIDEADKSWSHSLNDMNSLGVKKTCSFPPFLAENLEEDRPRALYLAGGVDIHGRENSGHNFPTSTAMKSGNEEAKLKRKSNGGLQNSQLAYDGKKRVSHNVSPKKSSSTTAMAVHKSAVELPNSTYKSVKNSSKTSVEEDGNGGSEGQSSSSNNTDDEKASRDSNGGSTSASKAGKVLNSDEKIRAARGSATDPQSIYARKRRERINERLRILQKLVPNGTKVDISTMLEEAVDYVKFLQLQIKLLSSDDHWMYAPIAYNGMDIGLPLKIDPPVFD